MIPVGSTATNTHCLRRVGCVRTWSGHGLSEGTTRVEIGRCTVELVPCREWC